ncbi:MAG: very short patch repair endonuclease [Hoeflea sp.]|uniref:very short patch repair endonuclease n=1 Tax=Hoeflea sp. TaxID=1940281 RepID=UPI0027302C19|nr:very short patch repair endonuclease [Hoeflea sp.]MDP2121277.1 very short patch repair endonuclease [Hoeflea sp.]
MDRLTTKHRSWLMSRVRGKNTRPELVVRRLLHRLGYRFRLHRKDLPGKPDLVFPSRCKVLFVHGCFWHGHTCKYGKLPSSNIEFWREKIERNKARDAETLDALRSLGWETFVIWQCEIKDIDRTERALVEFLEGDRHLRPLSLSSNESET